MISDGVPLERGFRLEADPLGEVRIPTDAYYGAQTARAMENFRVTGRTIACLPELLAMLAAVKKSAALANVETGELEPALGRAIAAACDEVMAGGLTDQFAIDPLQGGAGTSTNMNMNEVLAARAAEILSAAGEGSASVHPNDHVNRSQSTNDAYASAARLAVDCLLAGLDRSLDGLAARLDELAGRFAQVHKLGRTQLQDAVPMTVGAEFGAFANTLRDSRREIAQLRPLLREVNLGGTAIGTGVGATDAYRAAVLRHLAQVTGIAVAAAPDPVAATSDTGVFVACGGLAKRVAIRLGKLANDLRLLSSGPRGGLGELELPARQPGSSIMPGKVNPVIPELVNQVCYRVFGCELTVSLAADAAQLQLNAMLPVIYLSLSDAIGELRAACTAIDERCLADLAVNEARCRATLDASTALAVTLLPRLGYARAAGLAKAALAESMPFVEYLRAHHPETVALVATGAAGIKNKETMR